MGEHVWTNPLLDCEPSLEFKEYRDFKKKILQHLNGLDKRQISHVSIYFRDLNNGPWLGINETESFTPSSMLKVPVMIGLLRQAESDPSFFRKQVEFESSLGVPQAQNFSGDRRLQSYKPYTVEQLLEEMICRSDNLATALLLNVLDPKVLKRVYAELGIAIDPEVKFQEDFMRVKQYASFFRILYNASYLSRGMSEKALDFLTRTDFKRGLVAGVPKGVPVAHKYGERLYDGRSTRQLHDCGIIYHTHSPYLLCVMTRGDDFDRLAKAIEDVSRMVYQEVDGKSGNNI